MVVVDVCARVLAALLYTLLPYLHQHHTTLYQSITRHIQGDGHTIVIYVHELLSLMDLCHCIHKTSPDSSICTTKSEFWLLRQTYSYSSLSKYLGMNVISKIGHYEESSLVI